MLQRWSFHFADDLCCGRRPTSLLIDGLLQLNDCLFHSIYLLIESQSLGFCFFLSCLHRLFQSAYLAQLFFDDCVKLSILILEGGDLLLVLCLKTASQYIYLLLFSCSPSCLLKLSSSILNFLFYLVNLSLEFSSSYISLWHFSWLSFTVTISLTTYGDLCGSGGP